MIVDVPSVGEKVFCYHTTVLFQHNYTSCGYRAQLQNWFCYTLAYSALSFMRVWRKELIYVQWCKPPSSLHIVFGQSFRWSHCHVQRITGSRCDQSGNAQLCSTSVCTGGKNYCSHQIPPEVRSMYCVKLSEFQTVREERLMILSVFPCYRDWRSVLAWWAMKVKSVFVICFVL